VEANMSTISELQALTRGFAELARQTRIDAKESQAAVRAAKKHVDQQAVIASGWRPTLPMVPLLPPGWRDDRKFTCT
jgi:hypothetical protein